MEMERRKKAKTCFLPSLSQSLSLTHLSISSRKSVFIHSSLAHSVTPDAAMISLMGTGPGSISFLLLGDFHKRRSLVFGFCYLPLKLSKYEYLPPLCADVIFDSPMHTPLPLLP